MTLFRLVSFGVIGVILLAISSCVNDEGDPDAAQEDTISQEVSCTPTNYQWNYFRTSTGAACVYGAFNTSCANQISVNIAEYTSWGATAYRRIQGSGLQPSSARTGRLCAYACLSGPSTAYYYKTDLWDLNGRKLYMDWITGNGIPDPQKYSSGWPIYTSTSYPSGCTLSPPIPN